MNSVVMAPAKYSLIYLFSTFFIFLISNLASDVDNMLTLCIFLLFSYAGLYFGFFYGVKSKQIPENSYHSDDAYNINSKIIIISGCLYFSIWGINQIYEFGGGSILDIFRTIMSPGEAYRAKFEIYEIQLQQNRVSIIGQILIVSSIIYAVFIPYVIILWNRISIYLKAISIFSVFLYIAGFLYIGTMKGIGDIFLLSVAGISVLLAKRKLANHETISRRKAILIATTLGLVVFGYMAYSQLDRAETFGITESLTFGNVSNTLIGQIFGHNAAFAIYSVLSYPSHGYLGLSYNLDMPFVFSHGAGFSQAFESYRYQFLGGEDNRYLTYPFRTEAATGWPAGMYWATIFPWLASDLSFPGIPIFMALMGFVFARVWLSCLFDSSILALAAFGQFVIFIAFIPANNQVLMQRQGLWIVATLIALWTFQQLRRKRMRA